jgi:glycosyltransferase involved in cell wall biosynthesis
MMRPRESLYENRAWIAGTPHLSVLIPFLREDPSALLLALDREAADLADAVEIVVLDDGTGDDALAARVEATVARLALPARFVRLAENVGRAKGRNRLAHHARATYFLFLDSDMLPDGPRFLRTYLDLVAETAPAVVFGGFSLDQAPTTPEHALHRVMAMRSDCAPAAARSQEPSKNLFTSNLLVRSDVFETEAFDEGFVGWGWEDTEWAMRVAQRHAIVHIDNTATHLGLDRPQTIAAKYEQSTANFERVLARHPQVVERYPAYRAARLLRRVPLRSAWRPALKALALTESAPLSTRALAMRLYRAALYAEAIR